MAGSVPVPESSGFPANRSVSAETYQVLGFGKTVGATPPSSVGSSLAKMLVGPALPSVAPLVSQVSGSKCDSTVIGTGLSSASPQMRGRLLEDGQPLLAERGPGVPPDGGHRGGVVEPGIGRVGVDDDHRRLAVRGGGGEEQRSAQDSREPLHWPSPCLPPARNDSAAGALSTQAMDG